MTQGYRALLFLLAAVLSAPVGAKAATVVTGSCPSGTCISGASGVLIDGKHYTVDIREGTFNDFLGAGLFPEFGNEAWALSASAALIGLFNTVLPLDTVVNDIGTESTGFAIPFRLNSTMPQNVDTLISNCCGLTGWQTIGVNDGTAAATSYPVFATFVRCEPFPGGGSTGGCFPGPGPFPAPEPGTLGLLAIGLFGLAFARRASV